MNTLLPYFKNEWIKTINYKPIKWILIGAFLLSLGLTFYANFISFSRPETFYVYTGILMIFTFLFQLFILPLFMILLFLVLDIERQNTQDNKYLTAPISLQKRNIVKFIMVYLLYLALISMVFLVVYFVLNAKVESMNLPTISFSFKTYYLSHIRHFIFLPLVNFLLYYGISIYVKNYYLNFTLLLIIIAASFFNPMFTNPVGVLMKAINMEKGILFYGNSTKIYAPYILGFKFLVFMLVFLFLLSKRHLLLKKS